jgi:hypothetical protein
LGLPTELGKRSDPASSLFYPVFLSLVRSIKNAAENLSGKPLLCSVVDIRVAVSATTIAAAKKPGGRI